MLTNLNINEEVGNRLIIFNNSLNISVADFCRATGLGRSLVDKLRKGIHGPRIETLDKISMAYPELSLNWLVTGEGPILGSAGNDTETTILELFKKNIKSKGDESLTQDFLSVVEWAAQEYQELKDLDLSIKAHSINREGFQEFSCQVILQQRQRRAVSELLRNTNIGGLADTEDKQNKLKRVISKITSEIQKTINIIDGE
jgi:transcriptional regulator with XRE-family HTH domain